MIEKCILLLVIADLMFAMYAPRNRAYIWPFLIMAGSAIANAIIANRAQKKQNQKTNEANLALAKYQADRNEQFTEKQNIYNSPASQMTRFDAAGLNPNLVYSQGNPGNQAQAVKQDVPNVDYHLQPFQIPAMLSQYQDFNMKNAQIENLSATAANTREKATNEGIKNIILKLEAQRRGVDVAVAPRMAEYNLDIKHGEAERQHSKLMQQFARQATEESRARSTRALEPGLSHMQQQEIESRDLENFYKKNRNEFQKMGINESDNFMVRMLMRMLISQGFTGF